MTKETKKVVTDEEFGLVSKKLWEIQRRFKEGTLSFKGLDQSLQKIVEGQVSSKLPMLKLISGDERLAIEALDGKATIAVSENIFKSYADLDFKNLESNKSVIATDEILVDVYEIVGNGTIAQIFISLNPDLDKLLLTQAQVLHFCEKHYAWFSREGNETFFLIKENGNYSVVDVNAYLGGSVAFIFRLDRDGILSAECHHRVVVPQITSQLLKPISKLISGDEKIILKALDGEAIIADAKDVFDGTIDIHFKKFELNSAGPATPKTLFDVYEIHKDANFIQIFTSLNPDLNELVVTQNQIIGFCEKHLLWLRSEGNATLFLIKKDAKNMALNGNLFVVRVYEFSSGLSIHVSRFEDDYVWLADHRHRLVIPRLVPLAE